MGAESPEDRVEQRARELLHGGREGPEPAAENPDGARQAAEQMLEESEQRILGDAPRDLDDDSVIRRDSEETAATGEPP